MTNGRFCVNGVAEESIFAGLVVEIPREEGNNFVLCIAHDLATPAGAGEIVQGALRGLVLLQKITQEVRSFRMFAPGRC